MGDNKLLKDKFQKLHDKLVGQDLSAVMDRLFAVQVISAENMEELSLTAGWSIAKSRRLLTMLHTSGHPRAFTELCLALCELESIKWIVDELDQLQDDDKLSPTAVTDSEQCQCPNCGLPHQPASSAAPGQLRLVTYGVELVILSSLHPTDVVSIPLQLQPSNGDTICATCISCPSIQIVLLVMSLQYPVI